MTKLVKTPRQRLGEIINVNIGIKNAQFGVRTEKDFERKTGIKSSTYNTQAQPHAVDARTASTGRERVPM